MRPGKKILFLTNYFPYPPDTGTRIRSFQLLKYLASQGEVTLVSPAHLPAEAKLLEHLKEFVADAVLLDHKTFGPGSRSEKKISISRRLLGILKQRPWSLEDFIAEEFRARLVKARPHEFDLIFIRYPQLAYYFLTDPQLRRELAKVVIDVDDVGILMHERRLGAMRFGYGRMRHALDLLFLKNYYRKMKEAKACLVTSEADRRYLLENDFARAVFIVPNTVSIDREPSLEDAPANAEILFCGTLSFPHNEEAVIFFSEKIFPRILRAVPQARFTVIGKNPTAKVTRLHTLRGISVVGPVPATEPYYRKAAFSVVPLLNGAGTRIKILEAMAFGRPVVSTSVGAEGLDVTDEENILIADDPAAFADKCIELLRLPEKRKRIAANGFGLVKEKYGPDILQKRMDELFEILFKEEKEKACLTSVS